MKALLTLLLIPLIIFVAPTLGVVAGTISGWVVGLFFGDTILGVLGQLGLHGVAMWQVGATLGFCGAFFRGTCTQKSSD